MHEKGIARAMRRSLPNRRSRLLPVQPRIEDLQSWSGSCTLHPRVARTRFYRPVSVHTDGKFTLPLVGDLQGQGLTPFEIEQNVATALAKYIVKPLVTVSSRMSAVSAISSMAKWLARANMRSPLLLQF